MTQILRIFTDNIRVFFTLFLFFFNSLLVIAQFPCGTAVSDKVLEELRDFYNEDKYKKSFPNDTFYIPLKVHIIRNTDGTGGLGEQKFYKELDSVNYFYINSQIQFTVCGKINYIDNTAYRTFNSPEEEEILVNNTESPRVVNIYFTDTVLLNGKRVCGYSYLPIGPNTIFIDNTCVNNGNTVAHELGHFFSLQHTHGKSNTILTDELVNGSNCAGAGDFICDTPADPNLDGKVNYNPLIQKCIYTGTQKDANSELFKPMVENIMSYSLAKCTDAFTPGQFETIRNSLFYHGRIDLTCTSEQDVVSDNSINNVYPNPFHEYFFVNYQLSADSHVKLILYDLAGKQISTLHNKTEKKGFLKLYYSLDDGYLGAGFYLLKMEVNEKTTSVKKIMKINN